jgi:hypothetical protein
MRLVVAPELAAEVSAAWPDSRAEGSGGPVVRGLAAAEAGGRGACAVVTDRPLAEAEIAAVAGAAAAVLGVPVEVAALHAPSADPDPADLLRQWVNQAAQGSGRGVRVRLAAPGDGPGAPVRVLVEAIDSSARELAQRLASPWEPALPALRALLGTDVTVEDAEPPPPP